MVTTVAGNVATEPKHVIGAGGKPRTSFRLATSSWTRQADGSFADGPTSFLSITCFDTLAVNVAACVTKGQPVVVTGSLTVREYEADGRTTRSVDMVVRQLGHDLRLGQGSFTRRARSGGSGSVEQAGEQAGGQSGEQAGEQRAEQAGEQPAA
ncbi:MAG TPA: single-stranded DNA-binding protein [Actinomycetales bacterium]|jgi:single-strand DNA-binding protein